MSGVRAKDDTVALGTAMEPAKIGRMMSSPGMAPTRRTSRNGAGRDRPDDLGDIASFRASCVSPQWSRPRIDRVTGVRNYSQAMGALPQWSRPGTGRVTALQADIVHVVSPAAMEPAGGWPGDLRLGLALAEVGPAAMEPAGNRPDDLTSMRCAISRS